MRRIVPITVATAFILGAAVGPAGAVNYYALFMDGQSNCAIAPSFTAAYKRLEKDRRFSLRSNSLLGLANAREYARAQFCTTIQEFD